MNLKKKLEANRRFLKAHDWDLIPPSPEWEADHRKGLAPPSIEKPYADDSETISLTPINELDYRGFSLQDAILNRKSCRSYSERAMSMDELSFLLWATQGVHRVDDDLTRSWRTVPSGGARHPFETYLAVNNVEGLKKGVYKYLALSHRLLFLHEIEDFGEAVTEACAGQGFVSKAAALFVWLAIPYRAEWRYSVIAHKDIAIEAGHVCQNLYLACEAVKAGTCAITDYHQKKIDALIEVDGENEFTVYVAPVGKRL